MNKGRGIIYEDTSSVQDLPCPVEVMIGKDERIVPLQFLTTDLDMIEKDPCDKAPRVKMSCGHAIS